MPKRFPVLLGVLCSVLLVGVASEAAADSCSARTDLCTNVCFHRTGDAATRCFAYCKNEKRACLKTGLFRTTGGNYPGLDKR